MTERIVNISWTPLPDEKAGYNQIFRVDDTDEELLTKPSLAEMLTVAEASPFACPIGDSLLQFCERHGAVPNWVGMNDDE